MGMYTDLMLKCEIETSTMDEFEHGVFKYLFLDGESPLQMPEHPFFNCERWHHIRGVCVLYQQPKFSNLYNGVDLFLFTQLKNYDDEIDKFINWFSPFILNHLNTCIGWTLHESDDSPTLLFKHDPDSNQQS